MTTYLHVGMPKTGTTTLQASLTERARKWHHRHVTGWTMDDQHFVPTEPDEHFWDVVLASDESFCFADEQHAKEFRTKFSVKPFITVRRSASQWWSWWAQLVAHGETRTFDEWARAAVTLDPRASVDARPFRPDFVALAWGAKVVEVGTDIIAEVEQHTGLSLPMVESTWRTPPPSVVERTRMNNLNGAWASVEEREKAGRSQRDGKHGKLPGAASVFWTEEGQVWAETLHDHLMRAIDDHEVADELPGPPAHLLEESE